MPVLTTEKAELVIEHPKLAGLLDLWQSRRNGQSVPLRRNLTPLDLKPWMGNLAIVSVQDEPLRFRLRLVGTTIAEYDGMDHTGAWLDEVVAPSIRAEVISQYEECARSGRPFASTYNSNVFRGISARVDKLLLPLSTTGRAVDQILVGFFAEFGTRMGA